MIKNKYDMENVILPIEQLHENIDLQTEDLHENVYEIVK